MGFVLANAITGHFDNAKTYIELGSGIGGMLFDIHGFTLNNKNRYYGVDYSEDGVEGGDAVFSLLSSEEYSPFWKFMQSDILDLPAGVFDASGQDTVVLTVSVLNKIPELPIDFFVKIRNLVCHARRIDMVIVESVGWQIYEETKLLEYQELGEVFQINSGVSEKIVSSQRQKNIAQGSNKNFMEILMGAHRRSEVSIKFIELNTFSHHPYELYSVFRIQIL